jgi:prolyl-tRNA editing enzyme YbaK/EbsC (Cys-tRNA(Pro) deacylase)
MRWGIWKIEDKKNDSLRSYFSQSQLKDEVLAVTRNPIGNVGPFGTARQLRILVDPSVFVEEEISLGSGGRGMTITLKSEDLKHALGGVAIVELLEPSS